MASVAPIDIVTDEPEVEGVLSVQCELVPKRCTSVSEGRNSKSSTFLSDKGKRTYMSTTSRITAGDELKQRNGLGGNALVSRLIHHRYQPPPRLPRWFDGAPLETFPAGILHRPTAMWSAGRDVC